MLSVDVIFLGDLCFLQGVCFVAHLPGEERVLVLLVMIRLPIHKVSLDGDLPVVMILSSVFQHGPGAGGVSKAGVGQII